MIGGFPILICSQFCDGILNLISCCHGNIDQNLCHRNNQVSGENWCRPDIGKHHYFAPIFQSNINMPKLLDKPYLLNDVTWMHLESFHAVVLFLQSIPLQLSSPRDWGALFGLHFLSSQSFVLIANCHFQVPFSHPLRETQWSEWNARVILI